MKNPRHYDEEPRPHHRFEQPENNRDQGRPIATYRLLGDRRYPAPNTPDQNGRPPKGYTSLRDRLRMADDTRKR